MDRMVECGGCDARFRINDEVIIRTKKYYPGERNPPQLNRFQRVPLSAAEAPEGMQTMRYAEFNHPEQLGPVSPQRVIAGIFGVALMAIIALMLIFSGNSGGFFSTMPFQGKLIVTVFVSLLGVILLYYANPSGRKKALFFGLLMGAGVVSLPFFIKGQLLPKDRSGQSVDLGSGGTGSLFPDEEVDPAEALRARFSIAPLEKEQTRYEESGKGANAYGVFLTGIQQRNIYTARDYLIRDTQADLSSHPYPRDSGSYLMVLGDVSMTFDQVAEIAGKLGETTESHPEIGLVVVKVNNNQFIAGSAEKLNNKTDPAFYELNIYELRNINIDRVQRAVERLADAEPTIYRKDITDMLIALLANPRIKFHGDIARALLKWADDPGSASAAALKTLSAYSPVEDAIPEFLVELAVLKPNPEAIPVLNNLWILNPDLWEKEFVKLGPGIETVVMEQLNSKNAPLQRSALKVLGKIGTAKSLPGLRKLLSAEDPEIRLLADRAVKSIESR